MTCVSQLEDLIETGRRILHRGCEQQLCDQWRLQAVEVLSQIMGNSNEYSALFRGDGKCRTERLLEQAAAIRHVRDMVLGGRLPVSRNEPLDDSVTRGLSPHMGES